METNVKGSGLALVCKWNEKQFGRCSKTSKDIEDHWFVLAVLDHDELYETEEYLQFYRANCHTPVRLELINYFCLPGEEMVGICKTFWLKIIQRKWKKIYAERKRVYSERMKTSELMYRERNGKWSSKVNYMPSLKGMMAN